MIFRKCADFLSEHFLRKKSSSRFQVDALDGLRGIAVLYVLLHHMAYAGLHVLPFMRFSGAGKAGVYLFFTLSSFLLTYPLVQPGAGLLSGSGFWKLYFLRRFFRVYPLYAAALFFSWAAGHFFHSESVIPIKGGELWPHLSLSAGKEIFWTIAVEFKYYFVIPIFAVCYTYLFKRSLAMLSFVTGCVVAGGTLFWWPPSQTALNSIRLGPYLPIFLLGSLTAVIQTHLAAGGGVKSRKVRRMLEASGWMILVISLLLIPSVWKRITGQEIGNDYFSKCYLMFALLWAGFMICQLNGTGLLNRFLCWDPLRFLGVISFSIYIWHIPVIRFTDSHLPGPYKVKIAVVFLLVIFAAAISYLIFEKPFLKMVHSKKN